MPGKNQKMTGGGASENDQREERVKKNYNNGTASPGSSGNLSARGPDLQPPFRLPFRTLPRRLDGEVVITCVPERDSSAIFILELERDLLRSEIELVCHADHELIEGHLGVERHAADFVIVMDLRNATIR